MAAAQQTIPNELSLNLSLLYDQDDISHSEEESPDLTSSSTGQDDIEELVIPDEPPKNRSESTKLDLRGLSDSSTCSSGPSISRDRLSTLPSVHQRPFLSSEAWAGSDTDSEGRNRRSMRSTPGKSGEHPPRGDSVDTGRTRIRQTTEGFTVDKLPSVPVSNVPSKASPPGLKMPDRSVAFGSTFMRDTNFQSTRLYGRPPGGQRLPPFLRAHTRERRLQSLSLNNTGKSQEKETQKRDADKLEMPKDFATLHLLARRAQGQMRYRYMAMLNEWIAEHGVPTT